MPTFKPHEMSRKFWGRFKIVTMTDPAARQGKRNCETAIVTVGWNSRLEKPDIYVLDVRVGKWSWEGIASQNYQVYTIFEPTHQGIENIAFQDLIVQMSNMGQEKPNGFNLIGHDCTRHGRDKKSRLDKAAYWTSHGRVFFKEACGFQSRLVDQLVSFQINDKFDIGDAYCMAVNQLTALYPAGSGSGNHRRMRPVRDPRTGRTLRYEPRSA